MSIHGQSRCESVHHHDSILRSFENFCYQHYQQGCCVCNRSGKRWWYPLTRHWQQKQLPPSHWCRAASSLSTLKPTPPAPTTMCIWTVVPLAIIAFSLKESACMIWSSQVHQPVVYAKKRAHIAPWIMLLNVVVMEIHTRLHVSLQPRSKPEVMMSECN